MKIVVVCEGEAKLMELTLENLEQEHITMTLWDSFAVEADKLLSNPHSAPVVLLLHMCRAKTYNSRVQITTTIDITKMLLDEPVDEIKEFHSSDKIEINVIDNGGCASFLLWDNECVELIRKTAAELKNELDGENNDTQHSLVLSRI